MAKRYGSTFTAAKSGTLPQAVPDGRLAGSKRRSHTEVFTMASQPAADQLYVGTLPIGAVFEGIKLTTSATLGAATLACGSEAAPSKYAAAATLTAVDTPTERGLASGKAQAPLSAPEDVYLTIAAAALPAAGTLVTELLYKTAA